MPSIEAGDVFSRFQGGHKKEKGLRRGRSRGQRTEVRRSGQRNGAHQIGRHAEMLDDFAPHRLADRQNHARAAQPDQPGRPLPHAVRLPRAMPDRATARDREWSGWRASCRDRELRNWCREKARAPVCWMARRIPHSHQRRSAAPCGSRPRDQIGRRALRHRERLVGKKRVGIFGKLLRQSHRKFGHVSRQPAGGQRQRRGIQSDSHGRQIPLASMRAVPPPSTLPRALFVLQFPVVIELGIVMRNAAFVRGIVKPVGRVDQHRGPRSHHFVSVRHAGRNQNLPRAQIADVDRIAALRRWPIRAADRPARPGSCHGRASSSPSDGDENGTP